MSRFTTLVLLTACAAVSGWPQLNRGTLTGIVSDPSGAVVPGVVVKAIHVDTGTTASTVATDTGNYTLPGLQIGTYRVEYVAAGFKKTVRDKLELTAGSTLRLDVALELGSVGESVEVVGQASPDETETT